MRRKAEKRARAQLTKMNFQKLQKLQNASIALAPTALVLEKSATRGAKQGITNPIAL